MTTIKEVIKKYIEMDNEIKIINKQLTPLRNEKKTLGLEIQEYLGSNTDNPNAVLEVGKDVFKVINVHKKQINKERVEDVVKLNTSEEVAKSIISELEETKEISYLKRTTKK